MNDEKIDAEKYGQMFAELQKKGEPSLMQKEAETIEKEYGEMRKKYDDKMYEEAKEAARKELESRTDLRNIVTKAELENSLKSLNERFDRLESFLMKVKSQGKAKIEEKTEQNDQEILDLVKGSAMEKYFSKKK